jgi:hypothetical protein
MPSSSSAPPNHGTQKQKTPIQNGPVSREQINANGGTVVQQFPDFAARA